MLRYQQRRGIPFRREPSGGILSALQGKVIVSVQVAVDAVTVFNTASEPEYISFFQFGINFITVGY
jgi:hypothetical protein